MSEVFYDFEDGAVPTDITIEDAAWSVAAHARALGTYSIGPDNPGNGNQSLKLTWNNADANGKQAISVEVHYNEDGSQRGNGIIVYDPSGVEIAGMFTDNPQWYIRHGYNNNEQIGNGSTGKWILMRMEFDWASEQVTFTFDESNADNTAVATRPFINSASAYGYLEEHGWNNGSLANENYHWLDDFKLVFPKSQKVEGVTKQEGIATAMDVLVYNKDFSRLIASGTSASDGTYSISFADVEEEGYVMALGDASHRPRVHGPLAFEPI